MVLIVAVVPAPHRHAQPSESVLASHHATVRTHSEQELAVVGNAAAPRAVLAQQHAGCMTR